MKIQRLKIQNFKAIKKVELENLGDVVIIVGANGVGKSCIFDAIRLLKSCYGEYNFGELNNWYAEQQIIGPGNKINFDKVLKNKNNPLVVEADFELSNAELNYLKLNGKNLIEKILWKSRNPGQVGPMVLNPSLTPAQRKRLYGDRIYEETKKATKLLKKQIKLNKFIGKVELFDGSQEEITENIVLEILFSTFSPDSLGIIDYHGAHRHYTNENISNLNFRLDKDSENYKNNALYNYTNKYNNVKTELASSYIKALLARESGKKDSAVISLNETLEKLFESFFPGKKFKGLMPTNDGMLEFPVELKTGEIHDISELSSGEKEILFGYLRLKNQAPTNSIILIDEPELHLNPKLSKQLPEFYHASIGKELNNQLWLVTHSESILKEAIGKKGFSVFHMLEDTLKIENQAIKISIEKEIEAAIIDLIGDISSYHQGSKVVIFEGIDSEFDKSMTNKLFPNFENSINAISAGSKTNVMAVQEILNRASVEGIINKDFISIVDRDSNKLENNFKSKQFSWDVYHIENYLLEEKFIYDVLEDLNQLKNETNSIEKIKNELKKIAEETIQFHLNHELNEFLKGELQKAITTRIDPNKPLVNELFSAANITSDNIKYSIENSLSIKNIKKQHLVIHTRLKNALKSEQWKVEFQGRDILKRFVGKFIPGIMYENFRNLIISEMRREGFQPIGMKRVIDQILVI